MINNNRFHLQEIVTNPDSSIEWVELIRVGKFDDGYDSKINITQKTLEEFKTNFDNKVRRIDLAIDYFHENLAEAAGWIKEVEIRTTSLFAKVEWTDNAKSKILGKEIRYISAEFSMSYKDTETGQTTGATLYGAGLTNRPHVKDMKPIFSEKTNQKKGKIMDFKEMIDSVSTLSEDEKMQLAEKLGIRSDKKELSEATLKLSEYKQKDEVSNSEITKLSENINAIQIELEVNKKNALFSELLHNAKVVEKQREAFMSNDMVKFSENAVSGINLEAKGSDLSGVSLTLESALTKFEEKVDGLISKGSSPVQAYRQAREENADLISKIEEVK